MTEENARKWEAFLLESGDPPLLVDAQKVSPVEDSRCHLQVISRATLLLFIATRAASRHLEAAEYTRDDMAFWWQRFGHLRGYWDEDSVPDRPSDIWADVAAALDDVEAWCAPDNDRRHSLALWRANYPAACLNLGSCEMIALWGLTP
jgi:hypothetical protein